MPEEKQEKKVDKEVIVQIVIISVLALLLVYNLGKTSRGATGSVSAGESGKIDTTGWTDNEIMNYEMHGTVPARAASSASTASSSGMVGGC